MKNYIQSFVRELPKNEFGAVLVFAAFAFTIVFGGMAVVVASVGGEVNLFPAFTLPIVFWTMGIAHYIARPLVVNHYSAV